MYFLFNSDTGNNLAADIPWWQLLLASAYRYVMEIPWGINMKRGRMPWGMASPLVKTPPYKLELFGKVTTLTRGLVVDGVSSVILGPLLATWAYVDPLSLPSIIIWAYQFWGLLTLIFAMLMLVTHLPEPNRTRVWATKADTSVLLKAPGVLQVLFASQLGFIIHALAIIKLRRYS
mmetsp:Transcript_55623/g.153535  ORF Transcript_55623/g.153535 Transcript_55623/m.153535 type:complete len:176 (+) Transcript_55623:256-783(+)